MLDRLCGRGRRGYRATAQQASGLTLKQCARLAPSPDNPACAARRLTMRAT
jgi:hypothetical protein